MRRLLLLLLRTKRVIILVLFITCILAISLIHYSEEIERKIFEIKIDPDIHLHNYNLSLTPRRACPDGTEVLVIVVSSSYHFSERMDVRGTWGMEIAQRNDMRYYFIIGLSSEEINNKVAWESHTYADIIRYDFIDTYYNLTLKSVNLLKWAESHCPNARFVVKIDDDITLNVTLLLELLEKKDNFLLHGLLITGNKRLRAYSNKYFVPKEEFPGEIFPNYVAGACYVMSQKVVSLLFNASHSVPYVRMEDVFITGICRVAAGLKLSNRKYLQICWK